MTDGSPLSEIYVPRHDTQTWVRSQLESDERLFHIAGQPGIGKTFLLDWIEDEFRNTCEIERIQLGAHHDIQTLTERVYQAVLGYIPDSKIEGDTQIDGVSASIGGVGAGTSWSRNPPDWSNNPFEYIRALEDMVKYVPDDSAFIITIDDIHKIDSDADKISDALKEISNSLNSQFNLISAGRLKFRAKYPVTQVPVFTEQQSIELLSNHTSISPTVAKTIHKRLAGHPYYLGLLIDIDDPSSVVDIPKNEIHHYIQTEYLNTLNEMEERFLQSTSPLIILHEHICSSIMSTDDNFDYIKARRMLRGLNQRVIVQAVGSTSDGITHYSIHDKFRDFLLEKQPDSDRIRAHIIAYDFYINEIYEELVSSATNYEFIDERREFCLRHFNTLLQLGDGNGETPEELDSFLRDSTLPIHPETILSDHGLFYGTIRVRGRDEAN